MRNMYSRVLSSCMVKPKEETPNHNIWLCNLDVCTGPVRYSPVIYVYKSNGDANFFNFEALKDGLARTLVPFYPYAGRLDHDHDQRIQIECTGEGVLLVEASCDSTVDEMGDFSPSPELRKLLLPPVSSPNPPCPLVMIQVTTFKCGGVCVGLEMHHYSGDGGNSIRFFNVWSDITRGVDPTVIPPPILERDQLRTRSPPSVKFDHTNSRNDQENQLLKVPTGSTVLHLTLEQIMHLKAKLADPDDNKRRISTFTALASHVWRCACLARELPLNKPTVLKFPASVRKCFNPPISPEAMCNALVHLKSEAPVSDIVSGNFRDVARRIEDTVASLTCEYVRSFIDFLEKEKNFKKAWMGFKASEVRVVSWLSFPLYEADFGWGKPVFVGRASQTLPGRFYLKRTHSGDGGVLVTVTLEAAALRNFAELFYTQLKREDRY